MELRFQTKAESKRQQLEAFLKLPKGERVLRFFELMEQVAEFPSKKPQNLRILRLSSHWKKNDAKLELKIYNFLVSR